MVYNPHILVVRDQAEYWLVFHVVINHWWVICKERRAMHSRYYIDAELTNDVYIDVRSEHVMLCSKSQDEL